MVAHAASLAPRHAPGEGADHRRGRLAALHNAQESFWRGHASGKHAISFDLGTELLQLCCV